MKKIIIGCVAIVAVIGIGLGFYFNNQNVVAESLVEEVVEVVVATPEPTIEPTSEPTEEPVEEEVLEETGVDLDTLEIPDGFVAYTHTDGSFYLMEDDLTEDEMFNMAEYGNPYGESGVPETPTVSEGTTVSGGTSGSTPSEDDGNTTTVTPNTDTSNGTTTDDSNLVFNENGDIVGGVVFGPGTIDF